MDKIKVVALSTHLGDGGLKVAGDEYEVVSTTADQLKRAGLVAFVSEGKPDKEKKEIEPAKEKAEPKPLPKKHK